MSAATAVQLHSAGKLPLSPHCCSAEQSAVPILAELALPSQEARPDEHSDALSKLPEILFDKSDVRNVRLLHDLQACNSSLKPRLLMRINSNPTVFERAAGPAMSTQVWRHLRNASLNKILPKI